LFSPSTSFLEPIKRRTIVPFLRRSYDFQQFERSNPDDRIGGCAAMVSAKICRSGD
jgi:hypothetical protein